MAAAAIMKKNLILTVSVGILLANILFFLSAYADDGDATYYTIFNPSSCYGYDTPTSMVASASDEIWNGGAACGTYYSVSCTDGTNLGTPHPCTGQTVTVQVVDYCQDCRGTFDLSEDAFAAIADINAGKILIQYQQQ